MKKSFSLFLLFFFLFTLIPSYTYAENNSFSDDPKAMQVASNSVIMLSSFDKTGKLIATGSAFAAFEEGVFVTNYHVIEDGVYSITAQTETGQSFEISTVVSYDIAKDIAILRTEETTGIMPLPIGRSAEMEKGEKVIAIGSPLGLINTLSIGLYSGTLEDERSYLQFSAAISHGSSGGALFNNNGEVVGITSASFTEGQNLNLAIPIEDAVDLWDAREKDNDLSIHAFYDIQNVYRCSVSNIISNASDLDGQTIVTEGYVYIDPNAGKWVYLVDTPQELLALHGAQARLFKGRDIFIIGDSLDNKRQLMKDTSIRLLIDASLVCHGDFIKVQGLVYYNPTQDYSNVDITSCVIIN